MSIDKHGQITRSPNRRPSQPFSPNQRPSQPSSPTSSDNNKSGYWNGYWISVIIFTIILLGENINFIGAVIVALIISFGWPIILLILIIGIFV